MRADARPTRGAQVARAGARQRRGRRRAKSARSRTRARSPRSARGAPGLGRRHRRRRPGADHRLPDPRGRPGRPGRRRRTRAVPARVVAYDLATGFGLVQALAPLRHRSRRRSATRRRSPSDEPLLVASGGDDGDLSLARMVSRRPFSGYWEYHIDGALFTAPPRTDHSGAGLFNADGELLGIGSLVVERRARRRGHAAAGQHVRAGRPAQADPRRAARARRVAQQHAAPGSASTASRRRPGARRPRRPRTARPRRPACEPGDLIVAHRRRRGRRPRARSTRRCGAASAPSARSGSRSSAAARRADAARCSRRPDEDLAPARRASDAQGSELQARGPSRDRRIAQAQAQLALQPPVVEPARLAHEAQQHRRQLRLRLLRARRAAGAAGRTGRPPGRSSRPSSARCRRWRCTTRCGLPRHSAATQARARSSAWMWLV